VAQNWDHDSNNPGASNESARKTCYKLKLMILKHIEKGGRHAEMADYWGCFV
jgi:hypothetical protein